MAELAMLADIQWMGAASRVQDSKSTPAEDRRSTNCATQPTICFGYSRPRRIVTNLLSCTSEAHLLTYLLIKEVLGSKEHVTCGTRGIDKRMCCQRGTRDIS